jgi:hypothetical protein
MTVIGRREEVGRRSYAHKVPSSGPPLRNMSGAHSATCRRRRSRISVLTRPSSVAPIDSLLRIRRLGERWSIQTLPRHDAPCEATLTHLIQDRWSVRYPFGIQPTLDRDPSRSRTATPLVGAGRAIAWGRRALQEVSDPQLLVIALVAGRLSHRRGTPGSRLSGPDYRSRPHSNGLPAAEDRCPTGMCELGTCLTIGVR